MLGPDYCKSRFVSLLPLIDRHAFTGIVLSHQRGRAYVVRAALIADHVDQIGAAELQIVFLAEFVKLLQVNTRHNSPFVATAIKKFRIHRPRPTRELQPVDALPVFDAVDFGRRGQTPTDSLFGQLDKRVCGDRPPPVGVAGIHGATHR
jgi:hypothetical protein